MSLLKRLFRNREEDLAPRPVPSGTAQTEAERDAAHRYWRAEVAADRKRRGATGKHP